MGIYIHKRYQYYFLFILFCITSCLYLIWSYIGFVKNIDYKNTDQRTYIIETQHLVENHFTKIFSSNHNRMPVFWVILSLVYNKEFLVFFSHAKILNIILSYICLVVIFLICKNYLPILSSLQFLVITAFTVFIYRAPYVQVEILFYTLFFISYLLLSLSLWKPTYKKSILTGIVIGITYLTKASVLPILLLFTFLYIFKGFITLTKLRFLLTNFLLIIFPFLLIIGPYLFETNRIFGNYFYNVNSTLYFWYDSYGDVIKGTSLYNDAYQFPNMSSNLLPSPQKYFREHTLTQMLTRLKDGEQSYWDLLSGKIPKLFYGYSLYIAGYLLLLLGVVCMNFSNTMKLIKKYTIIIIFTILTVISYLFLIFWYAPIAFGNRFILMLFLPFMFSIFITISKLQLMANNRQKLFEYSNVILLLGICFTLLLFTGNNTIFINGAK